MGAAPVTWISGVPLEMAEMVLVVGGPNGYLTTAVGGVDYSWPVWAP
jgi:hypothetical protein